MNARMDDVYPPLQGRRRASMDQHTETARRALWRAFRHGELSEEEFAVTLDRLEFAGTAMNSRSPRADATPDSPGGDSNPRSAS